MKFFQVLITNEFKSTLDRQYTNVYNYASLAEAMQVFRLYEVKDVADGITFTDNLTGRQLVQQHLYYEEDGGAVIELRKEYLDYPEGCTTLQFITMKSLYVKEINL